MSCKTCQAALEMRGATLMRKKINVNYLPSSDIMEGIWWYTPHIPSGFFKRTL